MIRFGPSGNSESFYAEGYKNTEQAASWLAQKGLNAFEYSFGRGVRMTEKKAHLIREEFRRADVAISAHAPYYINFANPEEEMVLKSIGYVLDTARAVQEMGGNRVVFHPATVGKSTREEAFRRTYDRILRLRDAVYEAGLQNVLFCPETMGKINQIGDLTEIAELCEIDPVFYPTIDFGHLNARTHGGLKTKADFETVVCVLRDHLPWEKVKNMHVHFSHIAYSEGGEVKHLTNADEEFGPFFEPLAEVLHQYDLTPVILSESDGTQAEDAQQMKQIYEAIHNFGRQSL